MKKMKKAIYICLGFLFLGIGAVGVVLPILPTTPFLLLSAALFAKGSNRFHKWFLSTNLYQTYLKNTIEKKEMRKIEKVKVLFIITFLFGVVFAMISFWHVRVVIVIILALHYYYFLVKIKTVKNSKEDWE